MCLSCVEKMITTLGGRSCLLSFLVAMSNEKQIAFVAERQPSFQPANCSERWYALFTRSNHEKKVAAYCAERRIEHYLPLYSSMHHWSNNRKAEVHVPLFPGYMFVRIGTKERIRVLSAPGAIHLVGNSSVPTAIPDSEIDLLRTGLTLHRFEPYPYLAVGARVRVRSGALAGMVGVIIRHKNTFRVVLSIELIQQSVALEADCSDLEPVLQDS